MVFYPETIEIGHHDAHHKIVKGNWKVDWNNESLIINAGDTLTFPENIEHEVSSSMTGESALYRVIATDDIAGPTWEI